MATGIVFFWNYSARNYFIFKDYKKPMSIDSNQVFSNEAVTKSGMRFIQAFMILLVIATASSYCFYIYDLIPPAFFGDYLERIKLFFVR